ncbi:F0F1 ATP synthase subunit epsilon [Methylocapsa acidiphila]|uniref:F0F1 ATP synthase subunit epsilon n=1 Tax=Methylocapsa acidiphila TaxID=133552 RepID=UPI000414BEF6|nr:F0F1 ATP synthase subunit epsilon [Methylocapsa acidiphila]
MAAFHFELVSPEKLVFSGDVDSVVVAGVEGEFTVLKDHAPLMSTLKPGVVEISAAPATKLRYFVRGGFADVAPGGFTILAERAIPLDEFDATRLAADVKDAEEDVADAKSDEARRLATEKRDQLLELKAALKI